MQRNNFRESEYYQFRQGFFTALKSFALFIAMLIFFGLILWATTLIK